MSNESREAEKAREDFEKNKAKSKKNKTKNILWALASIAATIVTTAVGRKKS